MPEERKREEKNKKESQNWQVERRSSNFPSGRRFAGQVVALELPSAAPTRRPGLRLAAVTRDAENPRPRVAGGGVFGCIVLVIL